ncbi:nucleotide exchange factor GrpE [Candidatus Berkelbacteria bacterium]|nr:nucleotide exchange factor GrpE [Candidatus Berkelbacteria bacterium]
MKKSSQTGNREEVEKLKAECAELKAGWQRTQADFENFRRRHEEERKFMRAWAVLDILLELAPILDNFTRAFEHLPAKETTWAIGFQHIQKQFEEVFKAHNLKRIQTLGETFDPTKHEALTEEETTDYPPGAVIREIEAGYEYNGKIVKPARVVVSAEKQTGERVGNHE